MAIIFLDFTKMERVDRFFYRQIDRCTEAVPGWNLNQASVKPIWHGLRVRPYVIPRTRDIFFGIFKQFGIDLLVRAKDIYASKHRRQVLDIQKFRDSMIFRLNNISTGKLCNYCWKERCNCGFIVYGKNGLWGQSKIYLRKTHDSDALIVKERTDIRVDDGVSYNQICKVLKNWVTMTDRIVGLLYLGTSKNRHDINLFKKMCESLNTFGDVPPNSCESIIYLSFKPGATNKYIGQTRKGLISRKAR